jgi:hypothetical protein
MTSSEEGEREREQDKRDESGVRFEGCEKDEKRRRSMPGRRAGW